MKYKHVKLGERIPADALVKRFGKWIRYYHVGVTEDYLGGESPPYHSINYIFNPKNIKYPVKEK